MGKCQMDLKPATIEVAPPKLFTTGAVVAVNAYGAMLAVPVVLSVLAVSVTNVGLWTGLIPLCVVAATAYFLPFGLGNTHITRVVRSFNSAAARGEEGFVVQLTLSPRLRSGFRALLEDADDIGYLTFSGNELHFQGDSVKLIVPLDRVELVRSQNIGLRGLFVYGQRIKVAVSGLPQVESIEFAERSSCLLPTSRAITRQLYMRLSTGVPRAAD